MTKTILIIGGSSDIGQALIERYLSQGHKVIATYRNWESMNNFLTEKREPNRKNLTVFPLEIRNYIQRYGLYEYLETTETYWDTLIFLNGTTLPIGAFMDLDAIKWEEGIRQNALLPCQFLQKLYKVRNKEKVCNVCFFSGGGINGTFDNFSSYTISKFMLHKFVELLDSECDDLNPFIIGPSFVKTKIHEEILDNKENAGESFKKAAGYLERGNGTPMEDIFNCIEFCCEAGKEVVGGRNIAVAHDDWRADEFSNLLLESPAWGKMRRHTGD